MRTRCKFNLISVEPVPYSDPPTSKFRFETRYCPEVPEDIRFTKWTPWGEMVVSISNPVVLKEFEVGKDYYVEIFPTEES